MNRRLKDPSSVRKIQIAAAVFIIGLIFLVYSFNGSTALSDAEVKTMGSIEKRQNVGCDGGKIEVLSWKPRVFIHRNFITAEEAEYIILKGKNHLSRSQVAGGKDDEVSEVRTSYGTFIDTGGDPTIMAIERRIADWTMIPVEHGESFYLLRYENGQQYVPHYDFFHGEGGERYIGEAGNRLMTVIIYLAEPEEGGETYFPRADPPLYVSPSKGDAILFYDMLPNGILDNDSLHGGNPVTKGQKWIVTKWIRPRPYPHNWWSNHLN